MQHVFYTCASDCNGCRFCRGGLALCTVCNGAEGELPTDCPGRILTNEERESIMAAKIDFRGDAWVCPSPEHG